MVMHSCTYGVYFFMANRNQSTPWLSEEKIGLSNLVWLKFTYWPNGAGLFVIYYLVYMRRSFKIAACYLFGLLCEQFFIGADYAGSYEGLPLLEAKYRFLSTELIFLANGGGNRVIHFSVAMAIIHLSVVSLKAVRDRYAN